MFLISFLVQMKIKLKLTLLSTVNQNNNIITNIAWEPSVDQVTQRITLAVYSRLVFNYNFSYFSYKSRPPPTLLRVSKPRIDHFRSSSELPNQSMFRYYYLIYIDYCLHLNILAYFLQ